ncbi:hypothetical protein ACC691_40810, partial [Rhizobium johnstonii]|uniref:hypothetical protein n=1 Tax=Rhizobium johnstonii TaxID=3019933 RepID=UPI003F966F71
LDVGRPFGGIRGARLRRRLGRSVLAGVITLCGSIRRGLIVLQHTIGAAERYQRLLPTASAFTWESGFVVVLMTAPFRGST